MDDLAPASGSVGRPCGQPMEQLKRVASAIVILPPLLFFLYYAPPGLFSLFVLALVAISLHEYFQMLMLTQLPVCSSTSYVAAFLLVCSAHLGGIHGMSAALSLGLVLLCLSALCTPQLASQRFLGLLHSLFAVLFIGWPLSYLVLLRGLQAGKWYLFFLCAIVWIGDSMAMYVGKSLGRHKMAPSISPGKTWEGAAGGVLAGLTTALIGAHFLLPELMPWQSLCLGLVVTVGAQVGDLGESMIKRYAGVKDSGELIPGHGGLLDRIDSLLLAAPMLLYAVGFLLRGQQP